MHVFSQLVLAVMLSVVLLNCRCAVTDDDWIDPYDMENFDPSSNSMKGKDHEQKEDKSSSKSEEEVSSETKKNIVTSTEPGDIPDKAQSGTSKGGNPPTCSQATSPCVSLFKQYVKSLLYHIRGMVHSGAEDLNLRLKVTAADVEYLERYTDPAGSEQNFHHVHEILTSMVKLATEVQHGDPSVQRLWIETFLGMPVEKFLMFAILAGIVILTFVAATKFHFSWWKLSVKLIFILFVISVFWQWYELYKKEEAKQHMTIMKEMPPGCQRQEKDASFALVVWRTFTSSFTFEKDECLQYYEHMLIDPFWKVTPTQALAKTLIRFCVAPARDLGEAIREFFTGLLKDLPAQLWLPVIAIVAIFYFLLLFMYFGYRVSLPFGLIAVEPGSRGDNSQVQRAIAQQNEELKAIKDAHESQLKQIMDVLKDEREALQNQLENQERVLSLPGVQSHFVSLQAGDQKAVKRMSPPVQISDPMPMLEHDTVSASMLEQSTISVSPEIAVGKRHSRSVTEDTSSGFQDLSQDEKGTSLNYKASDTESFEEISVSNIEADTIGQRDN